MALLILMGKAHQLSSGQFVLSLVVYFFLFRPVTDYYRLLNKGIIKVNDFWKCFSPFLQMQYFKELYLP